MRQRWEANIKMKITGVRVWPGLTLQFHTVCTLQAFNSSKATNPWAVYGPPSPPHKPSASLCYTDLQSCTSCQPLCSMWS